MELSVQLYAVRDSLAADAAGTFARLAEIGFTRVEPFGFVDKAQEWAGLLAANGLSAPTAHASLLAADQDKVFAAAAALGVGTVFDPYLPAEHWQSTESVNAVVDGLNAAAAKGIEHGIRVGYHNHDWELSSQVDGTTALEYFSAQLDPAVVLEVDTYWAAVGGQNPAELLGRIGSRVVALHLKDGPISKDTAAQLPVGQGAMDIPALLAASGRVEVGVIEFDDYAGDIFDGLAASLAYLKDQLEVTV